MTVNWKNKSVRRRRRRRKRDDADDEDENELHSTTIILIDGKLIEKMLVFSWSAVWDEANVRAMF